MGSKRHQHDRAHAEPTGAEGNSRLEVADTHPSVLAAPDQAVPPPLTALSTTAFGSASGTAGVSINGNSTYSITLPVVPGRGDMQPSPHLAYDSNQNGPVGVGWGLQGVTSVIAPCGKERRPSTASPTSPVYCSPPDILRRRAMRTGELRVVMLLPGVVTPASAWRV